MNSLLDTLNFELPADLIAKVPTDKRTDSKLLSLRQGDSAPKHGHFSDLLGFLRPGDTLVLNDTKVIKARLQARKKTGAKIELVLSRAINDKRWICLAKGVKKLKTGTEIEILGPEHSVFCEATSLGLAEGESGAIVVDFEKSATSIARAVGEIPLPPYIDRQACEADAERYQTVFANQEKEGAVAAPTAGLHFDEVLLDKITAKGITLAKVTLHVGPGTFLPIRDGNIEGHQMHAEPISMSQETADLLNQTQKNGGRIIAVGTTCVRVLESVAQINQSNASLFAPYEGLTRIFIKPGYQYLAVNALVTNFHLPQTTLLLLVAAAIGQDRLKTCYQDAIAHQYRFFSYGDACYFELPQGESPPTLPCRKD